MPEEDEVIIDDGPAGGGRKKKLMTIAIVAGLMLGEGAAIYWVVNKLNGPPAELQAGEADEEQDGLLGLDKQVEIQLPEISAFNKKEGRQYLFHLKVTVLVRPEDEDRVNGAIEARKSTIQDRFNTVIRSAELKYLNESGLDTIRRQFRFELDEILGDDQLIQELVIPKFFQSPADV